MKNDIYKLLSKLLFITLLISVVIFYCEIGLREVPNGYTEKKKYLEADLNRIQVLVLGSSHEYFGINPQYFDLTGFNLAGVSQTLYYDKELTMKYIDRIPNLKVVFIAISYTSLGGELYNNIENWRDYYYYHFWNIKPNNSKIFDLKQISFIDLYGTEFSRDAALNNFKNRVNDYDCTENGWYYMRSNSKLDTSELQGKSIVRDYNKLIRDELYPVNTAYLEFLLSEIVRRNITPVLITAPVYKTFSKFTDPDKLVKSEQLIKTLCSKYHCEYYNYTCDMRFTSEDFQNPDHLNNIGAEKFSRIINTEILKKLSGLN